MDRLNALDDNDRMDLPTSVEAGSDIRAPARFSLRPITYLYAGLIGFCCCSAAVILTAGLIALRIQ